RLRRLAVLASLLAGCRQGAVPVAPEPAPAASTTPIMSLPEPSPGARDEPPTIRFHDATDASGIDFVHRSGNSPEKYAPTANGSGVALLDFDGDGLLD